MAAEKSQITQLYNCYIIRDHKIVRDDLWIRNGKFVNPEPIFYDEMKMADVKINCQNMLIAPGFIDLQINGGFGYDFSDPNTDLKESLRIVAKEMLKNGVTAFCPTLITLSAESYHRILPQIKRTPGNAENGATNLGVHLEGPFISHVKRGAHPEAYVKGEIIKSVDSIKELYKYLDDVSIITMAPELDSGNVIRDLTNRGITVSLGHSAAALSDGERGINNGANFITHLFNAMLPFHHRDPGLVGLLTSSNINKPVVYYGIIADGIHTHYAALKIAYNANPRGMVLVTDAISAMGLESRIHHLGNNIVEVKDNKAYIMGTNTLCGAVATMDCCVRNLRDITGCSKVEAIECASLHPSQVLGITNKKGTLNFGSDADFIILDDNLNVLNTFIAGQCVWKSQTTNIIIN